MSLHVFSTVGVRLVLVGALFSSWGVWGQEAPAPAASTPQTSYAVSSGKLKVFKLFRNSITFGKKRAVVVTCTPASPAGKVVESDLRWAVAQELTRAPQVESVVNLERSDVEGCPAKAEVVSILRKHNAELLVQAQMQEDQAKDGEIPVLLELMDEDAKVTQSYTGMAIVTGEEGSSRVEAARARGRFLRKAWKKDYDIYTTTFLRRGFTTWSTTRVPQVVNEDSQVILPEELAQMPGMEDVQGRANTLARGNSAQLALSVGRWFALGGSILGGILVGGLVGLVFIVPSLLAGAGLGTVGVPLVGALVGGLVGVVLGTIAASGLTAIQDVIGFALGFVRLSLVNDAVNIHNKVLGDEYGVTKKDVEEEYFP